jgi:putative transcriptional regulator
MPGWIKEFWKFYRGLNLAVRWSLRSLLAAKYQIYTVTDLQKRIVKKTGVVISVANLCNYVNRAPKMVRLETVEIICSALECELSHFLSVSPKKFDSDKTKKLSFKNTPKSKIATKTFPEPGNYEDMAK